jgi:signal transduction histidine kinase
LKITSPRRNREVGVPVVVAFVVVAVVFVVGAIVSEVWASKVDQEAEQLEMNALPSVEHLAAARDALWHLEIASTEYLDAPDERRAAAGAAVEAARTELGRELETEFSTDKYPGETPLEVDVQQRLAALDRVMAQLSDVVTRDEAQRRSFVREHVRSSVAQVDAALHRLVSLNAAEGDAEAHRIAQIRAKAVRLTAGVTVACIAFAAGAASVALRSLRRQRALELQQETLLAERSTELERFASRVAHDLLSPLSALQFTLSSLKRNVEKGVSPAEPIQRAEACVRRARALVDGVMDFARSGGSPGLATASVAETLDGVLEEARADSEGVTFVVAGLEEDVFVACGTGILNSILSNLVRNAVKYMEDQPDKRVTVRVAAHDGLVRVQIEDTGPGLTRGLEEHVFEPYVRGADNPKPGLGLGLATVQRFVQSHGGHVGVDSSVGGCTFWFELPRSPPSS